MRKKNNFVLYFYSRFASQRQLWHHTIVKILMIATTLYTSQYILNYVMSIFHSSKIFRQLQQHAIGSDTLI